MKNLKPFSIAHRTDVMVQIFQYRLLHRVVSVKMASFAKQVHPLDFRAIPVITHYLSRVQHNTNF